LFLSIIIAGVKNKMMHITTENHTPNRYAHLNGGYSSAAIILSDKSAPA